MEPGAPPTLDMLWPESLWQLAGRAWSEEIGLRIASAGNRQVRNTCYLQVDEGNMDNRSAAVREGTYDVRGSVVCRGDISDPEVFQPGGSSSLGEFSSGVAIRVSSTTGLEDRRKIQL